MDSVVNQLSDSQSLLQVILEGTIIGQLVLLFLLLLSSLSWAIIILKWVYFRRISQDDARFLSLFREVSLDQAYKQAEDYPDSPSAFLFRRAYQEINQSYRKLSKPQASRGDSVMSILDERLQRVMERSFNEVHAEAEQRLNILASISGVAPYIGLFGTVLGVIDAFQGLGVAGTTSLAAVAPGISEALIATAAGLLAAIPALMAYNYFRNHVRRVSNRVRDFSLELTNRIEWVVYEQLAMAGK
jgi:biopolymer transport protein TolQ